MDIRDLVCAFCEMGQAEERARVLVPGERHVKKHTYELPSGRKLTVVMDDEGAVAAAAA